DHVVQAVPLDLGEDRPAGRSSGLAGVGAARAVALAEPPGPAVVRRVGPRGAHLLDPRERLVLGPRVRDRGHEAGALDALGLEAAGAGDGAVTGHGALPRPSRGPPLRHRPWAWTP